MKRLGLILLAAIVWMLGAPLVGVSGSLTEPNIAHAAANTDILADNGDPVCVAVPIFAPTAGNKGDCPKGQVEIPNDPGSGGAIIFYLKLVLKLINGIIGGIIILVLVIAGIQYITSLGDPTKVKNAKGRIQNAIIALVLYLMMFAILNFLVPGGILK